MDASTQSAGIDPNLVDVFQRRAVRLRFGGVAAILSVFVGIIGVPIFVILLVVSANLLGIDLGQSWLTSIS